MITVKTVNDFNSDWVKEVTKKILDLYDGNTYKWNLQDSDEIWKIHLGVSAATLGVNIAEKKACIKFFYDNKSKSKIRNILGFSKALRTFTMGNTVISHGVQIPKIFAYSKDKFSYGFVFSELLGEFDQVDRFAKSSNDNCFWSELGRFIRSIHDRNITHKDLSPRNIMVKKVATTFEFLLLDYEDCKVNRNMSESKRLKDLHHMYERLYPITDDSQRKVFIDAYVDDSESFLTYHQQLLDLIKHNPSKYTI